MYNNIFLASLFRKYCNDINCNVSIFSYTDDNLIKKAIIDTDFYKIFGIVNSLDNLIYTNKNYEIIYNFLYKEFSIIIYK